MIDAVTHVVVARALRTLSRLLNVIRRLRPPAPAPRAGDWRIILTMRYESDNPIRAFVQPLAAADGCHSVEVVVAGDCPELPKVRITQPPRLLAYCIGPTAARLITFVWRALVSRPDLIGGFHLLFNGVAAVTLAAALGKRSLYFCVGGPTEVLAGGAYGENRLLGRLKRPSAILERCLLEFVGHSSIVVTMGSGAAEFFARRGISKCVVLPGAIDGGRFFADDTERDIDVALVARLVPVKRPQLFVDAVGLIRPHADVKGVVIGDGPLRAACEAHVADLGIAQQLSFVGQQRNVEVWLRRVKIFVLTSRSEGVALAMLEAMLSGAVPVVADVGDLRDVVRDGLNGVLVSDGTAQAFAAKILALMDDRELLTRLSAEAVRTACRYEQRAARSRWNAILSNESADASALAALEERTF